MYETMRGTATNNPKAPAQGGERQVSRTRIVGYLLFNFASTVFVTFINKICFSRINFGYPAALCNIHYGITWVGVEAMRRLNMFVPLTHPPSSLRADVQFRSIVFLIGTVTPLNNTSLKLNSIGFYQLFKLLVTPAVVLLEYVLDGKVLSRKRTASLVAVCAFVLVSSGADLEFDTIGTICATIWVPLAAGYKVQWGRVQKQYSCSTPALMHAVLPYAIVVQTMISPIVDPPGLLQFQWTPEAVFWLVLSGIAAFLVNLSGFLVMGHAGALTHVLLGQLKTSVICLGAYYMFDAHYTALQLCGAAGAIASIVAYTHATTSEKARRAELGAGGTSSNEKALSALPLLDKKCSDM